MRMDALAARQDTHDLALGGTAPSARLGQTLVGSGLALVAAAGLLLCVRRLGGALSEPLSPAALILVSACLALTALLFRAVIASSGAWVRSRFLVWAAPTVALALWVGGLTLPGSDAWGLSLFCGLLLLEEGWSWGQFRGPLSAGHSPAAQTMGGRIDLREVDRIDDVSDAPPEYDEAVSQHVVRRQDESGETMQGWVRTEFAPGQRIAAAHLAICPPFERAPTCEAEQQDGPPAQVKVTQSLSYGVRLEIKLDAPAEEPTCVIVEFSIQEQAAAGEPH
jgi:hypothetical protein